MISLELRAAEGGEDARLLIGILAECYRRRATTLGWKVEEEAQRDGFLCLRIEAPSARWRQEGGGHRFQRVPPTERRGRVHTSTVTVSVLDAQERRRPEREAAEFHYRWFSSTGAGGQHANKHPNSLCLTHIPSGVSVKAQGRHRPANEREAMAALLAKLDEIDSDAGRSARNADRAGQVGSGMRGDKIRTYRLQDDTVTDHRNDKRTMWRRVQKGDFDGLL